MTSIIGARVDPTTYDAATAQILEWSRARDSRYVCVANAHVIMEAHDSAQFRGILNDADLVTPDGMPLVWMLRLKGHEIPDRVYGPTLMHRVVSGASIQDIPVGLYGSTPQVLELLLSHLKSTTSGLRVPYAYSPPFRELTPAEDKELCLKINQSGIRILFVGLGCPRQERWMAAHRGRINVVMMGVGAAFDFLSGAKPQAPRWMQELGLEWLFRIIHEPRRLWKRYLVQNPRFAVLALTELLGSRRG